MSWRWIVDVRDGKPKVDRPRLFTSAVAGLAVSTVLLLIVPAPWKYVVIGALAVVGITADILLRRRQ